MILERHTRRVKLSRSLNWGVGRKLHTGAQLWTFGGLCLAVAAVVTVQTIRNAATPPITQPKVLGAATTERTTTPPSIQFMDYQIGQGDTLFNISQQFSVPWATLAELNDIKPPFNLRSGNIIKVPIQ